MDDNSQTAKAKGRLAVDGGKSNIPLMNLIRRAAPGTILVVSCSVLVASLVATNGAEEIRSYRVPKEPAQADVPAGHSAADGHGHGNGPSTKPKVTYVTPEGWRDVGAGEMRAAGFSIVGTNGQMAQVAVTPLPGMAGKESVIVNMWRQQVGLSELSEAETVKELAAVDIGGEPGKMFDMSGKSEAGSVIRIVTAMMHRGEQSWFFKLQGDDELVTAQKTNFVAFLKSVKIEATAAGALPDGHPPIAEPALPGGHPPIAGGTSAAKPAAPPVAREGGPKWTAPAGWTEISGGQFLFAKFTIAGEGGAQAAVNVSTSAGDGGGLSANVNRWLGQIGKSPWSEAELAKNVKVADVAGGKVTFVEMNGADGRTGQPAMILGATTTQNGQAWFYKLMGEPKLVEAQREAFTKFVKGVNY